MTPDVERVLDFDRIRQMLADRTGSPMGHDLALNAQFARKADILSTWHDQTGAMVQLKQLPGLPSFRSGDVRALLPRIRVKDAVLEAEELVTAAEMMQVGRSLRQFLADHPDLAAPLTPFTNRLVELKNFELEVVRAIAPDFTIKDEASPELRQARVQVRTARNQAMAAIRRELKAHGMRNSLQDDTIVVRRDRFAIPVKTDFKGRIPGIVLDTSSSGETVFIEPETVVGHNNALTEAQSAVIVAERKVLKGLTAYLVRAAEPIAESAKAFGFLDFISARAQLSIDLRARRPLINTQGRIAIRRARHPLLTGDVVPIDLFLGEDFLGLVITGPNTGGKTVALKTLGVLTLMAHMGLFIPALDDAEVPLLDGVYTSIGDEQSLVQNLSTFSSHLARVQEILAQATKQSLVLLDELGTGTDPREGAAIGMAILEALIQRKSRFVVTTHSGRIKQFALQHAETETASAEFDIETLEPRYTLHYGVAGSSNALDIAQRLNFPPELVKRARALFKADETPADVSARKLEHHRQKALAQTRELEAKLASAEKQAERLSAREAALAEQEAEWKRKQKELRRDAIKETRRELLELLEQARAAATQPEVVRDTLRRVEAMAREDEQEPDDTLPPEPEADLGPLPELAEGVTVKVAGLTQDGIVQRIDPRKGEAKVAMGSLTLAVSLDELTVVHAKQDAKPAVSLFVSAQASDPGHEINLLGRREHEARQALVAYLDQASSFGRAHCRVIHGMGQGILRQMVQEVLREHPHVASHGFAIPEHGGFGVTEIDMKTGD